MDLSKSVQNYLDELSSNSPTPGGGNVAAFCGVLSSSLGMMVCNLTIGKKKYADVENEMTEIENKFNNLKTTFLKLAKKDNDAFDKVMDAFKLPKESEEQKSLRGKAIENATILAANIPAEVIATCKEVLPLIETVAKKGNQNSLSDSGVALSLIGAANDGAFMNVLINCSSLSNQLIAKDILSKTEINYLDVKNNVSSLLNEILNKMRPQ
ncbi:MAG: methenyltetrahydrofolate cyclohydrolase [Chlorobiaceae bacterium]|nr:methenyltetrahydrofolate cyclohydrolase [Chlorobiaceae bacterium]MBA4308809.1 methenyltetrahydrofolate cyclohydrolase [Chlorobiaceae bacterium]